MRRDQRLQTIDYRLKAKDERQNFFQVFSLWSIVYGLWSIVYGLRSSVCEKRSSRGFTLIEMIVAIVLLAILAGVVGPLLGVTVNAIGLATDRMNLDETANAAFARMSREIRRIRDDTSIVGATANQLEFVDLNGVAIRYRLVGNTLMRRQNANPESGLADQLQAGSLAFTYYDDAGNAVASPVVGPANTDIRRVSIQMTLQDGSHLLPVEIQIRPRNLRHENERFF